jgi:hypothetical protein
MNITRGQVFCAFIGGWVLCPWEILAQAVGFLNFMAGYTIVLGPICGIMIADVSGIATVYSVFLLISGSFGSCIAPISMFHPCIDQTVDTATGRAL